MVDGLFKSKISYGVQMYGRVRVTVNDPESADFKSIQIVKA